MVAFLAVMGSAVAAEAIGLTLAVGAFIGGLVLSASPYSHQLFAEVLPLRGVLLGIFFTAVGMLFDPTRRRGSGRRCSATPAASSSEGGLRRRDRRARAAAWACGSAC